jgi:hypothetical protein
LAAILVPILLTMTWPRSVLFSPIASPTASRTAWPMAALTIGASAACEPPEVNGEPKLSWGRTHYGCGPSKQEKDQISPS